MIYKKLAEKEKVDEDLVAFGGKTFFKTMYSSQCFRNIFYARCQAVSPILIKIAKLFYRQKMDLQIESKEGIGGGMKVYHGESTIVYAKSIGKKFTVYQQVTVGRGKNINGNDSPIIGDNVTVYAGAIIVGGVQIGNNATIGAGAVVVKDVPECATVVGAPVRVIEYKK